jgi:Ca-activated chloride channel family protein
MNDYEGLNLPQLLELMRGIVMPEPVSRMPEGSGWWVLLAWLAMVVTISVRALIDRRRRNRYRREAMARLEQIAASAGDDPSAAAAQIAVLLKQAALAAYPRADVASLYGEDWARFLNESASNDPLVEEASMRLATASYRPDADGRELVSPARRWIRIHRA